MKAVLFSSLEKIFLDHPGEGLPLEKISCLGGEEFAWQILLQREGWGACPVQIQVESPLGEWIQVFQVGQVPCSLPAYPNTAGDDNYLTKQPGLFPDPLLPLSGDAVELSGFYPTTLWVNGWIPEGFPSGDYPVRLTFSTGEETCSCAMTVHVVGADLPKQTLMCTQWFHGDCLADHYKTPVYSQRHWELWETYLRTAVQEGMNMVLTPVFTPPLDTEPGKNRLCTQLLGVEKQGQEYRFDFTLLHRFVEMAQRCGVEYFEISHLFTQWGAKATPAIYGTEGGVSRRLFGWDTPADSQEYAGFLRQLLPKLTDFLREHGLSGKAVFHISDEPGEEHLDSYRRARELVKPYLGEFPLYDALSEPAFYDKGLVDHPVAATDHIEPFLERHTPGLWAYYCCAQGVDVANRFLAMLSARNRILGWQLYKYNIAGFLHWGYNFWYSQNSRQRVNPWMVTDASGAFPGGDPFLVYPGEDGPVQSLRLKVFHHGLQDMRALQLAEKLIGADPGEQVFSGYDTMTFSQYPRQGEQLLSAREKLNQLIEKNL